MKNIVVSLLFLLTALPQLFAQKMEGEITYEAVHRWSKIYSRLTFLSKEEKDRMQMTWGGRDEYTRKMVCYIKDDKSLYTTPKERVNEGGYSWNEAEYKIYRDFEQEKRTEIMQMLDRVYVIEDSLKAPKWKVMNKIKEIAGYMCMMAVTEDTIKGQKITAWFADNLPIPAGPDLYYGLPGMILELDVNDGDVVTTATKVDLKPIKEDLLPPKKIKGRRISGKQYVELISTHIRDSMKAYRNPYWSIPY
jgi:GLPGLI family protein